MKSNPKAFAFYGCVAAVAICVGIQYGPPVAALAFSALALIILFFG